MNRLFCCWLFVLGATLLSAVENNEAQLLLPPEPKSQVSDETNWLSAEDREHWESQLTQWKKNDHVDVFLVILPTLKGTPAEHVCKRIGDTWGSPDLHGVVLYSTDAEAETGPWVWWGGQISEDFGQDPRVRKAMISRMEKRAGSEITEPERIKSAVHELSDSMRVLRSKWQQTKMIHEKFNESIYRKWTKDRVNRRAIILILSAAALIGVLFFFWMFLLWRRSKRVYLFPITSPQRRFGAPHAGGSGGSVMLAKNSPTPSS